MFLMLFYKSFTLLSFGFHAWWLLVAGLRVAWSCCLSLYHHIPNGFQKYPLVDYLEDMV